MTIDETTTVNKIEGHQLAPLLADPEPMWVALVSVQPVSPSAPAFPLLAPQIQQRLKDNLREYDELYELPNGLFAIVLRTLADAPVLQPRLQRLYDSSKLPYVLDGQRHEFRVVLGAAIRWPEEGVDSFLSRAADAMKSAEQAGGVGPVLL